MMDDFFAGAMRTFIFAVILAFAFFATEHFVPQEDRKSAYKIQLVILSLLFFLGALYYYNTHQLLDAILGLIAAIFCLAIAAAVQLVESYPLPEPTPPTTLTPTPTPTSSPQTAEDRIAELLKQNRDS